MPEKRAAFAVAVWDEAFVEKFAAFSLRTQLSGGNLPALSREYRIEYHIFTTAESREQVLSCCGELERWVKLKVHDFNQTQVGDFTMGDALRQMPVTAAKHQINRMTAHWLIDRTLEQKALACVLDSDLLFTDGSFGAACRMIEKGARVVAVPTLRLSLERTGLGQTPFLEGADSAQAGISCDDLARWMVGGLHHASECCVSSSAGFTSYPTSILWPVGEDGFLCRSVFPHPLLFVPSQRCRRFFSTIDYEFALRAWPEKGAVRLPGLEDGIGVCKLSTEEVKACQREPRVLSQALLARFLLTATNKHHRDLFSQPAPYLRTGFDLSEWRRVENASQQFITKSYTLVDRMLAALTGEDEVERLILNSHCGPIEQYMSPGRLNAEQIRAFHTRN